MATVFSDEVFVWTNYGDGTAALGNINTPDENGNGFVLKTEVSGEINIPGFKNELRVVSILRFVFRGCHKITSIKFPNTLKRLEEGSVTTMNLVKEIRLPASITFFGKWIDYFGTATKFIIEEGSKLKSIGDYFLRYSPKITEVILPPLITSIGKEMCDQCTGLKLLMFCGNADMSGLVTAFRGCSSLQRVIVPNRYKGTSFGGVVPWVSNLFYCKANFITCKQIQRRNSDILLYVLISALA